MRFCLQRGVQAICLQGWGQVSCWFRFLVGAIYPGSTKDLYSGSTLDFHPGSTLDPPWTCAHYDLIMDRFRICPGLPRTPWSTLDPPGSVLWVPESVLWICFWMYPVWWIRPVPVPTTPRRRSLPVAPPSSVPETVDPFSVRRGRDRCLRAAF